MTEQAVVAMALKVNGSYQQFYVKIVDQMGEWTRFGVGMAHLIACLQGGLYVFLG